MQLTLLVSIILILIGLFFAYWLGARIGSIKRDKYWESELPDYRKEAILKSRAVIGGQFSEQLAPYLPDFNFLPTECKFVGKPIDFLVFKGMDEKEINEIVFVEVKSGNSKLSSQERSLREAIEKKNVRWVEYRIPEGLTGKGNIEDKIQEIVKDKKKRDFR
jgi:predicted Holliday junction resolvase-like endonuclease